MRIVQWFIIPLLVCAVLFVVLINNQRSQPGELVLEKNLIDLGEVPVWEGAVTRSVQVRNQGQKPVIIERTESSCGCSVVEGPDRLAPGEVGAFQVTFDPKAAAGISESKIQIFTDSPKIPQVTLTLLAKVKPTLELSSPLCDFGTIRPDSVHEKQIRLRANAPLDLTDSQLAPSEHPNLSWKFEKKDEKECILKIRLGPVKTKGLFSAVLTILLPDKQTMTLPVIARVVGTVQIQPGTLFYGTVLKGDEPVQELVLESEVPFSILQIDLPSALAIENPPRNASQNHFAIKFRLKSEVAASIFQEEIYLLTSADSESFRVPAYAVIKPRE